MRVTKEDTFLLGPLDFDRLEDLEAKCKLPKALQTQINEFMQGKFIVGGTKYRPHSLVPTRVQVDLSPYPDANEQGKPEETIKLVSNLALRELLEESERIPRQTDRLSKIVEGAMEACESIKTVVNGHIQILKNSLEQEAQAPASAVLRASHQLYANESDTDTSETSISKTIFDTPRKASLNTSIFNSPRNTSQANTPASTNKRKPRGHSSLSKALNGNTQDSPQGAMDKDKEV
jgi:hypothetical protein